MSATGGHSVQRFAALAARVAAAPARLGPVRAVAVDGPAGAGKTTFADRLADAIRATGMQVAEIHTDDLLDGWSDAITYWPRLAEWVLDPLRRGETASYRRYDWVARRFDRRWHSVPVPDVLVLEGVGCGRASLRPELTLLAWVCAEEPVRLSRWLARPGVDLSAEWARWRTAEAEHFARDGTLRAADLHIDGAPEVAHDPSAEFVRAICGRGGKAGGPSEITRAGEREAVR
jgi:cytidylate kinase